MIRIGIRRIEPAGSEVKYGRRGIRQGRIGGEGKRAMEAKTNETGLHLTGWSSDWQNA